MIDRRRACVWFGTGPLALAAARAAEPGVAAGEILIGQNITLQGGKNAYGVEVLAGIETLLADANRAGGVHGRRIVLRTLDDDNRPAMAEANARKLVEGGAFLLFGSLEGGPSTAVLKAAEELRVPFFGPMAGSPNLRRPYQPVVFPVRAEHREEFRALIRYGASIGHRRVGFFHVDSEVGRLHLANVRLAAQESAVGPPRSASSPRAWSSRRSCPTPGRARRQSPASTRMLSPAPIPAAVSPTGAWRGT